MAEKENRNLLRTAKASKAFSLSLEVLEALQRFSRRRGSSDSWVAEQALRRFLGLETEIDEETEP